MLLNDLALGFADDMARKADKLRIAVHTVAGARVIDCGAEAPGSVEAGLRLADVCLGGKGAIEIPSKIALVGNSPIVVVTSSEPVAACMASQYAGWEISVDGYTAMGSGPMRAAAGNEELFDVIGLREQPEAVVGVLETDKRPTEAVCRYIAEKCRVPVENVSLLYAPTNSPAGNAQVVARSVETALHKLHELGFDIKRVINAWGSAPLPPVADDALTGIGRTNDAILYGAHVALTVTGDDASLQEIGPKTPSSASPDYGRPFREVFAAYDHDFYRIDPLLFSPAEVTFKNADTGNEFAFGELALDVLERSFRN